MIQELDWEQLYSDITPVMRRAIKNYSDQDDIIQNAWIKAYRFQTTYKGHAAFKTWMVHIVKNCARDYYATCKRLNKIQDAYTQFSDTHKTQHDLIKSEPFLRKQVREVIETLSPNARTLLHSRVMGGRGGVSLQGGKELSRAIKLLKEIESNEKEQLPSSGYSRERAV
jgi:RNA polymerase sigma factor (sigma-70 family)